MKFAQETANLSVNFGPKPLFRIPFLASVCTDHFADLKLPVDIQDNGSEVSIFPSIPCDPESHTVLRTENGKIYYSPKTFPHYVTDFNVDFETYLNSFGAKTKSTLRRKVRKFVDSAGPDCFRQFKSPEELLEFHAQAREISKLTYQENLLDHGLPDTPEFKQKMIALAEKDQVRAYILYMQGNPAAYLYCPVRDSILYYDLLGYDPEYRTLSAGTVLQYLAFEQLFSEKQFRAFDFEEGEGQHKRQFATRRVDCCSLFVFKRSLKARIYISLNYLFARMTAGTLWFLDKTGLRQRVRQSLR
ncbi:MAG TPA: GNAT family N-acetyltransferase [Acidobacteriaceae bacterium]|nr:GNAT family N-acetyltransferase [Acidobacteriaceae bacterium]